MDRSGDQEVSLAEPQSSQRRALCFIGWASTTATGRQLAEVCLALPDLRRYKLNCFLCELCDSARVNFLRSAQAQQQSPGKTTKQKNARPVAGHQRWNRIGDADSDGPQKGRERAYAGLQRIHKKHFIAITKKLT